MTFSRREFLVGLCSLPLLGSAQCMARNAANTNASSASTSPAGESAQQPLITNYNQTGRALLVEGKTMVIALTFPAAVDEVSGSLPVRLEPMAGGGSQLTEPQELFFYPSQDRRTYRAIISAPLDVVEGNYTLNISARGNGRGGAAGQRTFPYVVQQGNYRNTVLTVDQNFSAPPPDVAAQMRRDFETMVETLKQRSPRHWREAFIRPVPGADKDNFGVRRTANGTKRYRHIGLDLTARMGTPVRAMNDGTVAFSMEQWTPGQTVCIDHGGSIFTKYNHLSERRVREGETVKRGQVIALSGQSGGQKTPPHLHLDVFINRTSVDPEDFMNSAARLIALEGAG